MLRTPGRPLAVLALLIGAVMLTGCGESAQEKATAQVCSARSDISKQIAKLQGLTISSNVLKEATASFEAMAKDISKIRAAQSDLAPARKEQVQSATTSFETKLTAIARTLTSTLGSGNVLSELSSLQPKLKSAVSELANGYKQALAPISCSASRACDPAQGVAGAWSRRCRRGTAEEAPWQCFHLRPLPQVHGSLRPRFASSAA